ncbi:MAG: SET domain-containing protein-lysine N-methyltransferase [Verrucomicrobia bacterium]|nr:SET domain-containing protein-lysine N-methyltransferase [Verrucomicrobiota bacterium]
MRYLRNLEILDPKVEKFARRCVVKGRKRGFFSCERLFLAQLYGHKILAGDVADVEVRFIDDEIGHGLFAARPFPPLTYLGVYTGILKRRDLFARKTNDYCFCYPCGCWSLRPLMIDAQEAGNEMRYINHSLEPNAEALGVPIDGLVHVLVRTSKAVEAGEQLTFDYGPFYWKKRKHRSLL